MALIDIRTSIKNTVGRSFTGIDTVLNELIGWTNETFGNIISALYDEQEWEHVYTAAEVATVPPIDNWQLPPSTKQILKATHIDNTSSQLIFYPVEIMSPADWYEIGQLNRPVGWSGIPQYDYSSGNITFPAYKFAYVSRVNYQAIPKFGTRISNNFYVYPAPGTNEVNKKLRLLLGVKPAALVLDTDTNTITINYPKAMVAFTAALLWLLHLGDVPRGTQYLQIATNMLEAVAKADEITKLTSIVVKK